MHKIITDSSIKAKPEPIECLQSLLAGKDVIANLPVGYGKILIYQIYTLAGEESDTMQGPCSYCHQSIECDTVRANSF